MNVTKFQRLHPEVPVWMLRSRLNQTVTMHKCPDAPTPFPGGFVRVTVFSNGRVHIGTFDDAEQDFHFASEEEALQAVATVPWTKTPWKKIASEMAKIAPCKRVF